jgi:hypothetical protein
MDNQFIVPTLNSYKQNYKTKWHTKKTWISMIIIRNIYIKITIKTGNQHILTDCALHFTECSCLRKISLELDLQVLLDAKKGLGVMIEFLDSFPHLLCWWLAWAACWGFAVCQSLVLSYQVLSISDFSQHMELPHGEFGRHQMSKLSLYALRALPCQISVRAVYFLYIYIYIFC